MSSREHNVNIKYAWRHRAMMVEGRAISIVVGCRTKNDGGWMGVRVVAWAGGTKRRFGVGSEEGRKWMLHVVGCTF
jgi:hypothetical protein